MVVLSNPSSALYSVEVKAGAGEPSSHFSPHALLMHRATPGASSLGGYFIASSEIRIVMVFLNG